MYRKEDVYSVMEMEDQTNIIQAITGMLNVFFLSFYAVCYVLNLLYNMVKYGYISNPNYV